MSDSAVLTTLISSMSIAVAMQATATVAFALVDPFAFIGGSLPAGRCRANTVISGRRRGLRAQPRMAASTRKAARPRPTSPAAAHNHATPPKLLAPQERGRVLPGR